MVCAVVNLAASNLDFGLVVSVVLATRHEVYESDACILPTSTYAIVNSIALEDTETLQQLKFRPNLGSQALKVGRDHEPLDIAITNSNYGGCLDFHISNLSKFTNNKPSEQTYYNVQLTSVNAFSFQQTSLLSEV